MQEQVQPSQQTTVLVVDDDALLCRALERVLKTVGYEVLSALDGAIGVEVSRSYLGSIDLVLADIMMPTGHGFSLVDTLARERPESKIVLISGTVREHMLLPDDRAHIHAFLEKPFSTFSLLQLMRSLL